MMITTKEDAIKALTKPKNKKITLLAAGYGFMGVAVCDEQVVRGMIRCKDGVDRLAANASRQRKKYDLGRALERGAVVLDGHIKNQVKLLESQTGAFICGGSNEMRFVDEIGGGTEAVLNYIREHMLFHTVRRSMSLALLTKGAGGESVEHRDFGARFFEVLGEPLEWDSEAPSAPCEQPDGKPLFTDVMLDKLKKAGGDGDKAMFKLFNPEGSGTWLVYGMEPDGDTLWVVADLGMGCVEYGTASLKELQSVRGRVLKLPIERDRYFDRCDYSIGELLGMDSLPASFRKAKEGAA